MLVQVILVLDLCTQMPEYLHFLRPMINILWQFNWTLIGTPKSRPASEILGNQTKPCDKLATVAMWLGCHFDSFEAGLWGELEGELELVLAAVCLLTFQKWIPTELNSLIKEPSQHWFIYFLWYFVKHFVIEVDHLSTRGLTTCKSNGKTRNMMLLFYSDWS